MANQKVMILWSPDTCIFMNIYVNVYSNDPDQMLITIPVAMNVGSECSNPGDLNGDGDVSILDIIKLINCILDDECGMCYDVNYDAAVNIQDIIVLINIILG